MDDISPNQKSFTRHLQAEDAPATITAYAEAIVQLRDFVAVTRARVCPHPSDLRP